MANNTYQNVALLGKNWNEILNALPKSERRLYKLTMIAALERQKMGTPSYRILNEIIGNGTFSPTVGHPWNISTDNTVTTNTFNDSTTGQPYTINIANGKLQYVQGTGSLAPVNNIYLLDATSGLVYSLMINNGNMTYQQVQSSSTVSGLKLVDTVTGQDYLLLIANGQLEYATT